ncbi:unnamed protein product [Allacma fusca]|uniref:Ectonucleotide pyrophosphatase/phosphodiesterase family member 6 n=1 Tax=Allacma fusca TaxID=39272 RepID=A0A8J2NMJ7_9HEXA|nr:unnamed protein product [Allacma fusca]
MKGTKLISVDSLLLACLALGFLHSCPSVFAETDEAGAEADSETPQEKLLVIMLDGFRWDYYDLHKKHLNAFQHFISEGVHVEWVEPIFPPVSYPSWTTVSTGVFPETHGVIGNYMFDLNISDPTQAVFDIFTHETTSKIEWWQNSEPIWTTATRYGKKTFLRFWSRCDVPFNEVKPFECTPYREARGTENIRQTFNIAVQKLKQDFDLVMVYGEHIDNIGHKYGPNSNELKQALIDVNNMLNELLDQLIDSQMDEKVNIVILSDHGMTWTGMGSGVQYISLDSQIDKSEVYRSVDRGSFMAIAPFAKHLDSVYQRLLKVEGVDVYKREEIPDEYHYKNARLAQDILVVAKEKYFIRGLLTSKQIPRDKESNYVWEGNHGYPNMPDMRGVFFAKGPAFKKGIIHKPIHLEDVYQIFARILDIPAGPHNGSWSRVSHMLVNRAVPSVHSAFTSTLALAFIACRLAILFLLEDNSS